MLLIHKNLRRICGGDKGANSVEEFGPYTSDTSANRGQPLDDNPIISTLSFFFSI